MRVILSGGGTGGHFYPAVAVAEELKKLGCEILFVGAEGKMEMEKVPLLGWRIEGLPTAGLHRGQLWRNVGLPRKVWRSLRRARRIIKDFRPDVVVGFGGYASAPVLWAAQRMGVPTVIQEQNSYAGLTNKILARRARAVCTAYDDMSRFFPSSRIVQTGNPLRFSGVAASREEALRYFGFEDGKPVVLVVGGSLGTRTLNEMMKRRITEGLGEVQAIWQTGKFYAAEMDDFMAKREQAAGVWRRAFIERMDLAYAAADVVVSRSGAITVSELMLAGKAVVFVPSPNVAEDHQTKNAQALVSKGAAAMVSDADAVEQAFGVACGLLADAPRRAELERNIRALATADAAQRVAEIIINYPLSIK